MPGIPISSSLGYVGVFLLLAGFFLILAGLRIIKVEKVSVTPGRKTWTLGVVLAVFGIAFLLPDIRNSFLPSPFPTDTVPVLTSIQKIDFDYQDSPINHGWEIKEDCDETKIAIEHISDSFVDGALKVRSTVYYAMDYRVKPSAQFGNAIEFVADFENDAAIYAFVSLEHESNSATTGWLKFIVGDGDSKPVDVDTSVDGGEWQLYIQPTSHIGSNWFLFRVDLEDAVAQTFGNDGWKFQKLDKLRIRGNMALDYISICKIYP